MRNAFPPADDGFETKCPPSLNFAIKTVRQRTGEQITIRGWPEGGQRHRTTVGQVGRDGKVYADANDYGVAFALE